MDIDFDKLIRLQELDSEIQHILSFLEKIPRTLEDIEKKIMGSAEAVERVKEKLAQNQKKRRDLEARVKDIKAQIARYKRQLNEVKTNREYTTLLKEIEESQHNVDFLEEEIISEMLAADDIEEEIRAAAGHHEQNQEKLLKEKESLFLKKKEWEEKIAELGQEREGILPLIPPDQLALYLKIFDKKNSLALSPVNDDFCSICHMRVRPQVLNELRDTNKLILCENCGRILYWEKRAEKSESSTPA